jgi:hypothetical protein
MIWCADQGTEKRCGAATGDIVDQANGDWAAAVDFNRISQLMK